QLEIALTHFRVGSIISSTGSKADALAAYERSLTILEQLVQQFPKHAALRTDYVRTLNRVGCIKMDLRQPCLEYFERALPSVQELLRSRPNDVLLQTDLQALYVNMGSTYRGMGKRQQQRECAEKNRDLMEALVAKHPRDPSLQDKLAMAYLGIGEL